jgi:F-type H+-transporting ATPase subunit b
MKKLLVLLFILSGLALAAPQFSYASEPTSQSTTAESSTEEEHATTEEDSSVVGMFGLDWKLFIAQLINFAIVLFVLWKWVWKPVTANMEARTKKIEDSLNDAGRIKKEKEQFEVWKADEMTKTRAEASAIIAEAKQSALQAQAQVLEQSKQEQQALINRTQAELLNQKAKVLAEAQSEIAHLVVSSTEQLLRKKLDSKADQKLITELLKQTKD